MRSRRLLSIQCLALSFAFLAITNVSISAQTVLDGNVDVTGDLSTDGTLTTSGEALFENSVTMHGNKLLLHQKNGAATYIEFKDDDASGGQIKGYIKPNAFPGDQGIFMSLDGTTNHLGIVGDGSVHMNNDLYVGGKGTINGDLTIHGNFRNFTDKKAHMYLSNSITYTLGENIDFTNELDPNNNVPDAGGDPFGFYMAPEGGYYIVTLRVVGSSINIANTTTGTPIALLEVTQLGTTSLSSYMPVLSYGDQFNYTLSGILRLNQGDMIMGAFSLLSITQAGYEQISGTINLDGDVQGRTTYMTIHYLSSSL